MHKLTVLAILLVASLAVSSANRRTRGRLFQMGSRSQRVPFQHRQQYAMPSYNQQGYYPQYNMHPTYNMGMPGIGRPMPDGEYYSAMGKTTVDGSDISYDSHDGYMPMGAMPMGAMPMGPMPMMG